MSLKGIFPSDRWDLGTRSAIELLEEEDYNRLLLNSTRHSYKKGEVIFRENTMPAGILLLDSGMVKKYKTDHIGKKQIIYIAKKKELIGYHAVLTGDRYFHAAAAMENSVLFFIPTADFMFIINSCSYFALRLLKVLSQEFKVLSNSISVLRQRTASERIAIALIVVCEKSKEEFDDKPVISLNISRGDLADMAGIAKENAVRILKDFKQEGLIEIEGQKLKILDIKSLVKRANYR